MRIVNANEKVIIPLGRQGENGAVEVRFPVSGYAEQYGAGAFELLNQRPGEDTPYTCTITVQDGYVSWVVQSADVALIGHGKCELTYVVDELIAKSTVFGTCVLKSVEGSGTVPAPYESRIQDLIEASANITVDAERAETAQGKAEDAQEAAETAQGKAEDAQEAAETAQGKAEDAQEAAETAQEAIENLSVAAQTLSEGSSATVEKSVDPGTGVVTLSFGIPKGADGAVPAAAIAPTESTLTASRAYAIGERFWYSGTLYAATSPIASGGAIVISGSGANVKTDEIGADLTSQSEKIDELNSTLNVTETTDGWGKGSFNTTDGGYYPSSTYIRNGRKIGLSTGVQRITCPDTYRCLMYAWDLSGSYVGAYKTDGTWSKTSSGWKTITDFDLTTVPNYVIRIAMARYPTSESITASEGTNLILHRITDDTLTKSGKAADAKAVEEVLSSALASEMATGTVCSFNDGANKATIKSFTPDENATKLYQTGKNFFPKEIPTNVINGTISSSKIATATNARVYAIPCPKNTDFYFQRLAGSTGLAIATSNKLPAVGDTVRNLATLSNTITAQFNTGTDNYILINLSAVGTQAQLVSLHAMISIGTSVKTYEAFKDAKEYSITNGATDVPAKTIQGINNFWTDTQGSITIEYYADTKIYLDSKNSLIKALLAPVLDSMVADTALSANDFRIVGDTLYKITSSIASGGTLTPNTNCVATTIGAEITAILNS